MKEAAPELSGSMSSGEALLTTLLKIRKVSMPLSQKKLSLEEQEALVERISSTLKEFLKTLFPKGNFMPSHAIGEPDDVTEDVATQLFELGILAKREKAANDN